MVVLGDKTARWWVVGVVGGGLLEVWRVVNGRRVGAGLGAFVESALALVTVHRLGRFVQQKFGGRRAAESGLHVQHYSLVLESLTLSLAGI